MFLAQEEYGEDGPGAGIATIDPVDDDGYVSPEFDLTPSSDEDEDALPPPKRTKGIHGPKFALAEEEELALQLLRTRR